MTRFVAALAIVLLVVPATAQPRPSVPAPRPAAPAGPRTVAVAPLATLGSESTTASTKKLTGQLEAALAGVPTTKVVPVATVLDEIKRSKKPQLRACDGDGACLAELGRLVAADWVVYGEIGGLGEVQVIYLKLVDVASGKEIRSTTLQSGDERDASGGARGAAMRLCAPERYVGRIELQVDVAGAVIYIDGKRVARSPTPPVELSVGTHALRVTHPEFRDFVRFVDVGYEQSAVIQVGLQQFPVIQGDMSAKERPPIEVVSTKPRPWYQKWWAIAGMGAVLFTGAAITAGIIADGTSADEVRPINPPIR